MSGEKVLFEVTGEGTGVRVKSHVDCGEALFAALLIRAQEDPKVYDALLRLAIGLNAVLQEANLEEITNRLAQERVH